MAREQGPVSSPPSGTANAAGPTIDSPRQSRWLLAVAVLVVVGSLGLAEATGVTNLSATIIRIAGGEGTLVIQTDDPSVSVSIDGREISISGAGVEELRLRPGEYRFRADKDGKPLRQELVTITRGGREVVHISHEPFSPTDPSGSNGELAQADQPTVQDPAERHRLTEKEAELRETVRARPEDIGSRYHLGMVLAGLGKDQEAEEAFREVLRLAPENTAALGQLAMVLVRQGRKDEAVQQLREAVRQQPNEIGLRYALGALLASMGRLTDAEAELRAALALKPDDRATLRQLALVLRNQGKPAEADEVLRQLEQIEQDSDNESTEKANP